MYNQWIDYSWVCVIIDSLYVCIDMLQHLYAQYILITNKYFSQYDENAKLNKNTIQKINKKSYYFQKCTENVWNTYFFKSWIRIHMQGAYSDPRAR